MKTLLTLHLVELQPLALFIAFLALLLLAVSWMLAVKNSRYKELQEDLESVKAAFQRDIAELRLEYSIDVRKLKVKHIGEIGTIKAEHEEEYAQLKAANESINNAYTQLKASLPKPRERATDGKFAKGSDRLDNLCKHLIAGNRTDRYTAEEMFGIAHVGKFMARLKAEGFVVRKEKRRIAKDSFLTEYWFEAKKEAREWKPTEVELLPKPKGLFHGLTVKNPTETEVKAISDEAKRLGLECENPLRLSKSFSWIWVSPTMTIRTCGTRHDNSFEYVSAAEFIARMQPQQVNA